jgi:LmbE family N-acetylglucosaminyl deacetylase
MMEYADPHKVFDGIIMLIAPHMDDEVLACGGTMAALGDKQRIHVIYATDGSRSPIPDWPWAGSVSAELVRIRMAEAKAALRILEVPVGNAVFLGLPDGKLRYRTDQLYRLLTEQIRRLRPDHILAPFRFDRHSDHLAVNRAIVLALRAAGSSATLNEYFVYFRWRLLPGGDIRKFVNENRLLRVAIDEVAEQKRAALACYLSQTTKYYDWQDRPIVTADSVEEACSNPECFVRTDIKSCDTRIISRLYPWIRIAHIAEPRLKKIKDRGMALLYWLER